jgi:hypothetical protein
LGASTVIGQAEDEPHYINWNLGLREEYCWLVVDGWCWFVLREEYCWLVAGGWFVLREKYCWLVADKPSEQGVERPSWKFFARKLLSRLGKSSI